jgi:dienelactone hydrolase
MILVVNKWIGLAIATLSLAGCPTQSSINQWETVQLVYQDASVLREKVSYRSNGLKVFGQVCRPNRPAQFPIVVWNHGGFEGLKDYDESFCQAFATFGYTMLMSSYRGEDGSEGTIEVCNGEVDDVLRMLELGRVMLYVKPDKVVMMGGSHGGCISLRAVQKGAPAQVLVDFYGPTDWMLEYQQAQDLLASNDASKKLVGTLLTDVFLKGMGGTPTQVPQQYQTRSPLEYAASLSNWSGSMLVIHGVQDWFVLPGQSCDLAKAVGGFTNYRINAANTTATTAPVGCEASALTWTGGDAPTLGTWQGKRYLMVFDSLGHGDGNQRDLAILNALKFISNKIPGN